MGRGVPVRAVPLINGRSACGALLGVRHVARRARDVVIRDNGRTHRLERPIGGVAPARGSGVEEGGLVGEEEGRGVAHRGGGRRRGRAKNKQVQNLKKWGVTGGEHPTSGLAAGNPQATSGGGVRRRAAVGLKSHESVSHRKCTGGAADITSQFSCFFGQSEPEAMNRYTG